MVFAGRDRELETLTTLIEDSIKGDTKLILVTGEAGIGKSTLVKKALELKDYTIGRGEYLPESKISYGGFIGALQDIGLESTLRFSPRTEIQALMVTDQSGLLLAWSGTKITVDPDIFVSMLSAVGMFVADSLAPISTGKEYLSELRYGEYTLCISVKKPYTLISILKGSANQYLLDDMEKLADEISEKYGKLVDGWDGSMDKMKPIKDMLDSYLAKPLSEYSLDDEHREGWIHTNVMKALERFTREKKLVIVLEDIQWMDEPSVVLLHHLLRGLRKCKITFVATARSDEMNKNAKVMSLLNNLRREGLIEILPLTPLSKKSVRVIVEDIAGKVGEDIVNMVYKKAEGIPLFVEELAHLIVREKITEETIPETMEGVVLRRLQFCDEREVVEICAVCGCDIDIDAVINILGIKKIELLRILRKLSDLGIVDMDKKIRFHHKFERDVIYRNIPEPLRREYEDMFGEYYEIKSNLYLATLHYFRGSRYDKARELSMIVAREMERQFSYIEAMQMYRIAASLIEGERKSEMLSHLGKLLIKFGKWDEAELRLKESLQIMENTESFVELGALRLRQGKINDAETLYRKALKAKAFDDSEKLRAQYGLAICLLKRGDINTAKNLLLKFLKNAKDTRSIARGFMGLGGIYWYIGDLKKAKEYYEKALKISEENNILDLYAQNAHNLCVVLGRLKSSHLAVEYGKRSVEIKEKIGALSEIGTTYNSMGRILFTLGKLDDAEINYKKAIEYGEKVGDKNIVGISYSNLGILNFYKGNFKKSLINLNRAISLLESVNNSKATVESLIYKAIILAINRDNNAIAYMNKISKIIENYNLQNEKEWYGVSHRIVRCLLTEERLNKLWEIAVEYEEMEKYFYAGLAYYIYYILTKKEEGKEKAKACFLQDGFFVPLPHIMGACALSYKSNVDRKCKKNEID